MLPDALSNVHIMIRLCHQFIREIFREGIKECRVRLACIFFEVVRKIRGPQQHFAVCQICHADSNNWSSERSLPHLQTSIRGRWINRIWWLKRINFTTGRQRHLPTLIRIPMEAPSSNIGVGLRGPVLNVDNSTSFSIFNGIVSVTLIDKTPIINYAGRIGVLLNYVDSIDCKFGECVR